MVLEIERQYFSKDVILNVVIVIKEIIFNQLNYTHLYMTIGWSVVYVIVSMIGAKMMYEKEEVIFRA